MVEAKYLRTSSSAEIVSLYHLPTRSKTLHYMEMEATELFSVFSCHKKWQVQVVFPERLEKLVPKSLPTPPSCFLYLPTLCRLYQKRKHLKIPGPRWSRLTNGCVCFTEIHPHQPPPRSTEVQVLVPGAKPSGHVKFASAMSTITGSTRILAEFWWREIMGDMIKGPNLMRENCWSASHLSEWKGGSGRWKGSIAFQSLLEE